MFYTIYKITNKINGKIYIGKHITEDLNDDYMGSGKILKRAINSYGLTNFTKEILFQFDNEADMNAKEAEIVTEEFVKEDTNYNLCPGGKGGWGYINSNNLTPRMLGKTQSEYQKKVSSNLVKNRNKNGLTSKSLKEYFENNSGNFAGKTHTEETKQKMRKPKNKGFKNSQFGTMWITNGKENKKVLKDSAIPIDWYKGRVLK